MEIYAKVITDKDNVGTVLADCKAGDNIVVRRGGENIGYTCKESIPFGHKIAIAQMKKGDSVIKYGEKIGTATNDIGIGDWVHTHNVVDDYVCKDKNGRPLPGQGA